jgi:hypothetical protein
MQRASMGVAIVVALGFAAPGSAQTTVRPAACTMSCGCDTRLCYCSKTGGSGGGCRADGNACYVNSCASVRQGTAVALAADGSLVAVHPPRAPGDSTEIVTLRPVRWRSGASGHSVGLDCRGVVVAEEFDARAAASARARSRVMSI